MELLSKLAWYDCPMKSLVNGSMLKLLPLLFVAFFALSPMQAQAAAPGDGTFDCLPGTFDWGCRILSFLFETTNNDVTYVKDGGNIPEQGSNVSSLAALREMMRFFSNALLIFASIKLLYELIQMVAETAHTGQVGGKQANKLWAPIRLVIAIGLLVPLASGLNSGQYIVLQIAKWGSGMASQAWKTFAEKLAENQTFAVAAPPNTYPLSINAFKSYACVNIVDHFANGKLPAEQMKAVPVTKTGFSRLVFGNSVYADLCGYIEYSSPIGLFTDSAEAKLSLELSNYNKQQFETVAGQLQNKAFELSDLILPGATTTATAESGDTLKKILLDYQTDIKNNLINKTKTNQNTMNEIVLKVQDASRSEGWTSAGSWFLAITRAQGAIINGAQTIPTATGPNLAVLSDKYPDVYAYYKRFSDFIDNQLLKSNIYSPASGVAPDPDVDSTGVGLTPGDGASSAADGLFILMDKMAIIAGLWAPDERKAFGDLGGTTNPFAEIASLGYKKIRLALDFISLSATTGIISLVSGIVGGFFKPGIASAGLNAVSALTGGLMALLMMVVTLFMLAGVTLAFIVPMLPFTRFFFSILTWLGSVIEGMILVPFWALAFLTPNGEGFSGQNTRNGFFLILQIFIRPILCIFGLIAAMLLFYIAAKFLNASFYAATRGVGIYVGSAMGFMAKLVYSVMYAALIYSSANISFKMIEHLPKHALKWMGGSAQEESYDDHNTVAGIVGGQLGSQLLQNFQSLPDKIMGPANKAIEPFQKMRTDARNSQSAGNTHAQSLAAQGYAPDPNNPTGVIPLPGGRPGAGGGGGGGTPSYGNDADSSNVAVAEDSQAPAITSSGGSTGGGAGGGTSGGTSPMAITQAMTPVQQQRANTLESEIQAEVSAYQQAAHNPSAQAAIASRIQIKALEYQAITGRQSVAASQLIPSSPAKPLIAMQPRAIPAEPPKGSPDDIQT
ncbi:MAG: hypothetical protein EB059_07375 [Alphaproteobacteria bacterium]|nr:hypothetical protein [Alphaproteobacteria bacterium]